MDRALKIENKAILTLVITSNKWRAEENVTPNYSTFTQRLFWAKGNWEEADTRKALCPAPFV